MTKRLAVVTGAASGIGLALATGLIDRDSCDGRRHRALVTTGWPPLTFEEMP